MQPINYQSVILSARKGGDVVVLVVTLIVVIIGVLLAAGEIFGMLVLGLILTGVSLLYVRLYQISFLGNALRVQNGRHTYLLTLTQEIAQNLKMPYVDVFITQDPYLNAFAVGYTHPYTIVLHSATVEQLTQDELKAILVHEMGHIKYHHTFISAYIQPLRILVPVIGPLVGWLFGFWSRRAEMACDRLALAYVRDAHTVMNALIKVHVGAKFAEYLAEEGVMYQDRISKGLMKLLSQSLVSHPFLVTRVHELRNFSQKLGLAVPAAAPVPVTQPVNPA